jgi:hypothetical protein
MRLGITVHLKSVSANAWVDPGVLMRFIGTILGIYQIVDMARNLVSCLRDIVLSTDLIRALAVQ